MLTNVKNLRDDFTPNGIIFMIATFTFLMRDFFKNRPCINLVP